MVEAEAMSNKTDLWSPYRDLYHQISNCLYQGLTNVMGDEEFYNLLKKHKQNFVCLLQNPPKNSKSREELKKGMEEGITIKEIGHQILSRDLYQEAIILSDMYDLNEFVALDLLCTAQVQMMYHPGLPRGLVAILLYYEGRKFLVMSLKLLVHARRGILWSMNIQPDLEKHATSYTDQLLGCGIFDRIFDLLRTLDLSKEIEKLQENVALGGPKHRRQVVDLFTDVRQCLSEVVFLWAAQSGLPREPTVGLLNFLRQLKPDEDAIGVIDNVALFMLLAALYTIDLSVLHFREDGEEIVQNLPILADQDFIASINTELLPTKGQWADNGLQGVVTLGFAITVSRLCRIPQYEELQPVLVNQKHLLAGSVGMKVFSFLYGKVLPNKTVYSDEIIMRRFHYLLTDFIVYMFAEVKQLRIRTEESVRTIDAYVHEGIEPPLSLPVHFEQLMMCLTKFYATDPLGLHYCLDYWCPVETNVNELYSYKTPSRSLELYKFIILSGNSVPGTSFVAFVNMLASLSTHPQAARYCFNLLKQNSPTFNKMITWDHFFTCFNQYYNNLKQEVIVTDTVYRRFQTKGITPQEIEGLLAVLNLIKVIAENDDFSRLALCEHPVWAPLTVLLGLVGCSVPINFKASLIFTLAALSKSSEIASQMWNYIEASQILQTIPTTSRYQPRGIQTELEEVESRIEEYPLTQSFLRLLDVLTDSGIPRTLGAGPRQPGFDPYLTYLVNVFLKFTSRSYKNQEERWIIGCACLKLFQKFLSSYEPQASDFTGEFHPPPGFHLMLVLNSKSEFLNLILFIIDEGQKLFAQYVSLPGQGAIEECILYCLNILERGLILQSAFTNLSSQSQNPPILTNLTKLLLLNNPRTSQPDYLISIAKYVSYYNVLPRHALKILGILTFVTNLPAVHAQFLNILLTFDKESRIIRNGIVECLDNGETNAKEAILKLLKQCVTYTTPNLSQLMLGFDLTHDISLMVFQPAGILNFPRTCLHSIFAILKCGLKDVQLSSVLLENAYEIVYLLHSNNRTTEPIMRFTKLNTNFFEQHVEFCVKNAIKGVSQLVQLSWLLKTLAIELKISCNKMQILHLQKLVSLLYGTSSDDLTTKEESFGLLEELINLIAINAKRPENINFIDAVRQVIQVLAIYLPYEARTSHEQNTTNIYLLRKLLEIAVQQPLMSDDSSYISATVLILTQSIRRSSSKIKQNVPANFLNDIFNYLLRWLMGSDAGCQNLRIHLYVALISFLHIAYPDNVETTKSNETFFISRLDASKVQISTHPLAAHIPTMITKCGDRLIDLICQDCVGGHDVAKMLAMLTFSLLINTNGENSWILFIVCRGYLKYIIDGILKSNDELKQLLEPSFQNLRIMYLYKAKLSLLLQIASTKLGAEHLLEHNIFPCLSNMNVLTLHPEVLKQTQLLPERLQEFIPGVESRYLEVFLPTLELCNATITSLSVDNYSAITQILDFIVSQLNAIEFVLRCGCPALSTDFLHELATVTSTIALVSSANVAFVTKVQETFHNYNVPMRRIQKHMMTLLSKFLLNEGVIQELLINPPQEGEAFQTSDRLLYTIQIISNLFYYLRNIATNSKTMLFQPSLGIFTLNLSTTLCDTDTPQAPTIGTIVQHLVDFVSYYLEAKNISTFLKIKLHDIPSMLHADLVDLAKLPNEHVDIDIVRNNVTQFITGKLSKKQKEMNHAAFIIDNALYLLWMHLDYYMLQAIPRIRHGEIADGISFKGDVSVYGASEAMWNVTVNDINNIKQGLVPVFSDSFSRQLSETTQGSSEVKIQFVEMLLRKIKRLLQFVPVSQNIS